MLLPSALPFDMYTPHQIQRPQRPKLQSFAPYDASLPSPRTGLFSSCRALQSILVGSPSLAPTHPPPPPPSDYFDPMQRSNSPPPTTITSPHANKRGRDEFEEDFTSTTGPTFSSAPERNAYKTPKRQRRTPLSLPLGLEAADFETLKTPDLPQQPQFQYGGDRMQTSTSSLDLNISNTQPDVQNSYQDHQIKQPSWDLDREYGFFETVLNKFNFTRRFRNRDATQTPQESTPFGWPINVLVGEENAGLPVGPGLLDRMEVDL